MSIAVTCQKCRCTFQVKDKYAGRPGACPNCHESLYVPAVPPGSDEEAAWCETELEIETLARSSPATPTPYMPPGKINFPCEACGHPLRAEAINAGRKVRCSACDHKFLIPATSVPIPAPAPKSVAPSDVKPALPSSVKFSPPPRQPKPVRDPRISRPRKVWGRSRKQPGYVDANGIWNELTQKDLEGGSDARPSNDPLEAGPHKTPKVPSFVRGHTPFEYRDESRGISNKQALSLGGAGLIVLLILLQTAARYERSRRGAEDRAQADAVELADKQVIDARHLFSFRAGYYVPGAEPNDPNQGRFYIDLECTGPIPHHGCRLFIKSAKTRGYVDVKNPSDFAGFMRFDFQVISTNTSDTGPFTAWMEDMVLSKHDTRHRISNPITFQKVSAPPQF